ncbi:long-chain-fatty-acid--CoA ligase 5-like isoform X2 [Tubulanus polymorphus]|uniref:long-chain-fatty-acid--CoA ligase 5-like isoform X2 n=2 Tax=Tubulanus polymorphus TaxID=672921 RepID=UPI003DA4CD60
MSCILSQLRTLRQVKMKPKPQSVLLHPDPGNVSAFELDEIGSRVPIELQDGQLKGIFFEDATTIYEAFERGLRESGNGPCLGVRKDGKGPYEWINYQEVKTAAQHFGSGLLKDWHLVGQGTNIGIYSKNRPEWFFVDLACHMFSMVIVPLYSSLGAEASAYMIRETFLETIIVEDEKKARDILSVSEKVENVKRLILIDDFSEALVKLAESKEIEIYTFQSIIELGKDNLIAPQPPSPSYIFSISYTSGSTGEPKGVLLTHEYILTLMGGFYRRLNEDPNIALNKDCVMISYLPMAHVYERFNMINVIQCGGRIGFYSGDPRTLMDDIRTLKPTYFPTVPRVLSRIYDEIWKSVNQDLFKKSLFKWGLLVKMKHLKTGKMTFNTFYDRIIFSKCRQLLGGNVKLMTSSSAPIQAQIIDFARCVFGCRVIEGYGQTEFLIATMGHPDECEAGHVGPPTDVCMIKLVDVPDMNYLSIHGKGEICLKCNVQFPGYYKKPEATAEIVDDGGWLHTGDIGQWQLNGCLRIIDRRKNIFKLAQGEYVAPERIETIYSRSEFVMQVFVDGSSLKRWPVAIIVPDELPLMKWAHENRIEGNLARLCHSKKVISAIINDLHLLGREAGLAGFEQVKNIKVHTVPFTTEAGLLTATLKLKRPALRKLFANDIKKLYEELEE